MPANGTPGIGRVPLVLHYHALGTIARPDDPHNLAVPTSRFRAQLATLRRRGYEFVTASDFLARFTGGAPPTGVCALTFDDGTRDNIEVLPEILREFEAQATIFACPGMLGQAHPDYAPRVRMRVLTESELRDLAALEFIEVGSHTNAHKDLGQASGAEAYDEMVSSKRALEEIIGRDVLSFAYPNGRYSSECPDAARRAGYTVALTCGARGSWLPYELRRESISSLDRRVAFELKTRGLWSQRHASRIGRIGRRLGWRGDATSVTRLRRS
jgi:peptidoglycan/xylan/chitin deacetylase (PgdA/CDA1 family)